MAASGKSRSKLRAHRLVVQAAALAVVFFLVFPIVVIVPVSFSSSHFLRFPPPGYSLQWYQELLSRGIWVESALLSLMVAVAVMILATILGTAAAIAVVRGKSSGRLMSAFILSPLIVPGIVVAIAVYFFYSQIGLVGSPAGMVLAHTALAVPYVFVNVTATLVVFDRRLEQAAMMLGANRWATFRHITLPIIRPGILAGALFAFIASFDELIVAIFISGIGARTLPARMWEGVKMEISPAIAAVATVTIVISLAAFTTAALLERRAARLAHPPEEAES